MKRYNLIFKNHPIRREIYESEVLELAPMADEAVVLGLQIGERHVDVDGDTWERVE
jgi:hypothetical protein